jgi:hypothetical protein
MGTYIKRLQDCNKAYLIKYLGKTLQFNFTSEMFKVHSSYP